MPIDPQSCRSRAYLATRHASRRGILVDGRHYRSPALEAALSSTPAQTVRIVIDPANLQAIEVFLQDSSTKLIVPMVALAHLLRGSSATVPPHGLWMSPASATYGAVARGRLDPQVETVMLEVCVRTFTSSRAWNMRAAYEILSARLAAMGLRRPSYSTFRRRARRWSMRGR